MTWHLSLRAIFTICCAALFLSVTETTAQQPTRVLIVGDSIMQAVARSLERQLARRDGVEVSSHTHIGTGLARLDLYDWHEKIRTEVAAHRPDTVLIMIGANDNQAMRTNGQVVRPGSSEWEREYARRAGEAMDIMLRGGVQRIHWLELPDMRDARLQQDVTLINRLVRAECDQRPEATYQETRSLLSREPGTYSPYIIQANGMPLDIRSGDGIHFNRRGADLLAERMIERIWGN